MQIPQQISVKPEVALAFGLGTFIGTAAMGLVARKGMHDLLELTDKQAKRHVATHKYVMEKLGPTASPEALRDIVIYMQSNLIASEEEGIEMGVPPTQE